MTHICVSKLTIIGSDDGLSPDRRQAIIWTNAGILLIGPFGTNFSENLIEIRTFSFKKKRLKVSSAKRRPFCLGLNELTTVLFLSDKDRDTCHSYTVPTCLHARLCICWLFKPRLLTSVLGYVYFAICEITRDQWFVRKRFIQMASV